MHPVLCRAVRGAGPLLLATALGFGPGLGALRAQEVAPPGPALVTSGDPLLLREQPSYEAVSLATVSPGQPVEVTGETVYAADGTAWLPAVVGGQFGYLPAGGITAGSGTFAAEPAPAEPVAADPAVAEPVPAAIADPAMPEAVAEAEAPAPAAPAPLSVPAGAPVTTTDANLRAGPSADAAVLQVLPPGTPVSVDGEAVGGYLPVTAGGVSGWLAADLLGDAGAGSAPALDDGDAAFSPEAAPAAEVALPEQSPAPDAPAPAPEAAAAAPGAESPPAAPRGSTGIAWPFAGGTWQVIQGYNNGTHTNRGGVAQYKYGLDWALADGESAGQPIFAPVSGTVKWVDRGSGGVLIDAGNGYGVALFHVTYDGLRSGSRVERGQRIGAISGPGGDGYMSTAHVETDVWRLSEGGNTSVPFVGPNALGGREFPDTGGTNQYMGVQVTP